MQNEYEVCLSFLGYFQTGTRYELAKLGPGKADPGSPGFGKRARYSGSSAQGIVLILNLGKHKMFLRTISTTNRKAVLRLNELLTPLAYLEAGKP